MKTDSCQFNQTITAPRKYRWLLNVSLVIWALSLPTQMHVEYYSCCLQWRKVVHQHLACISYCFIRKVSCKFTVQWRFSDKDDMYDVIQGSLHQWV